jgi:hypothetical protein
MIHCGRIFRPAFENLPPAIESVSKPQDESMTETSLATNGLRKRRFAWDFWAGGLPGLLMLPMLVVQVVSLWSRAPLRYGAVVVAIVGVFSVLQIRGSSTTQHPVRWWTAIVFLGVSAVLYAWAVWTFSPWLAHVACVGVFCGWALGRWGNCSWAHASAVTLLLSTTLPLPMNWDQSLNESLKSTAAAFASHTLDTFEVPNIFANGILRAKFTRIDSAELTTYGSIFALVAWGCFLCLLRHRSLLHGIMLTALAFLVYVMAGFLTLCLAVYMQQQFQYALIPEHWFGLHLGQLLVGLLSIALLDLWLALMFHPVPVTDPDYFAIFSFGNKILFWPHEDPQESMVPDDPDELELYEQRKLAEEQNRRVWPVTHWREQWSMRWAVYTAIATIILASLIPWWLLVKGDMFGAPIAFRTPTLEELGQNYPGADTLPARIGSWQKTDFRVSVDNVANLEWQYNWRGQGVTVRVSFPHTSPSIQTPVRSGEGWRAVGGVALKDAKGIDSLEFSQWENALGSKTYILTSALDSKLKPRSKFDGMHEERKKPQSLLLAKLNPEKVRLSDLSCWIVAECEAGIELRDEQLRDFQMSFESFREASGNSLAREQLESLMLVNQGEQP